MTKMTIALYASQAPPDRRDEAKRRMAAFARERALYHR